MITPTPNVPIENKKAEQALTASQYSNTPIRGVVLTACFAFVLLMLSRWVDAPLALMIDQHVTPAVNQVFRTIGRLGKSDMYIIAALIVYIVSLIGLHRGWLCPLKAGFDRLARCAMLVVATMAIGGLITLVLKKVVARARPEVLIEQGYYGLVEPLTKGGAYNSFPSSHTLTAFGVAAAIGEIAPRWRVPALLVATLVAVSRLINRAHFLTDVLAAAAIAIFVAHALAPYILDNRRQWMLYPFWRKTT